MSGPLPIVVGLGRCDEMRAEVLVSLGTEADAGVRLTGTLTGPRRGRDSTLPTTAPLAPLADHGAGPPGRSRAILTEPAYWTPDLPNLYRLEATVGVPGSPAPGRIDTLVGLRRLGVRGRSFWLDGRRWVPRAVVRPGVVDLAAAKTALLGVVAGDAAVDMTRSDEIGLAVLAVADATVLSPERVGAISRHPSVMLLIVHGHVAPQRIAEVRRAAGTMLIGALVDGHRPPPDIAVEADFLAVAVAAGGVPHDGWRSAPGVPVVAWRHDAVDETVGRSACDLLQRDLAAWGTAGGGTAAWDWAGYVAGRGPAATG